ncbi:ISAs1 family transposase [Pseudoalteromonas sp. PS5]|uniref:ISAs1 family transposase n=1 Tax=Pseudoalteromonas sp. PS5 TaxID=1437473 RepID=UPI001F4FE177|nr:ISAs1 family transposase [Pseudoalteromonas sp. PS5]
MFLIISAVLSGCEGWKGFEVFGSSKFPLLRQLRAFKRGISTQHSITRFLKTVETGSLVLALFSWVNKLCSKSGKLIIAFGGKTLRGASKKLHLVSVFDCDSGLNLHQRKVESKPNEIQLHCQKTALSALTSRGADCLFQVKVNKKTLYKAVSSCFETAFGEEKNSPEDVQVRRGYGC